MDSAMQAMLAEKAKELFSVCDTEQKGFITKRDMQRLCGVLPLEPDQIEDVFDTLDDDGNGYLTLEEFTDGFGSFMGMPSQSAQGDANDNHPEAAGEFVDEGRAAGGGFGGYGDADECDYSLDYDEQFHHTMEKLGAAGVFQEHSIREDSVKELWAQLQRDHPELVPGLESLLTKMTVEIQKSQESYRSLEKVLRSKSTEHDDEVRRLYEEMESQIRAEREKVLAEERAREKQLKEEMEFEIREKEKLCQELLKNHEKLQQRLDEINQVQTETSAENERLAKERDQLEEELQESRDALDESQSYVEELQRKFKEDRRQRAQAAIKLSEGIALERESLVRQLDNLRDVNKKLKDESDISCTGDGADRGDGSGEIVHFREGNDPPAAKEFNRQESLQRLDSTAAVVAGGETLADIMDCEDDDCEFDEVDTGEFGSGGQGEVVYETIESETYQPAQSSPLMHLLQQSPAKETVEFGTMVTPCPSRQATPPPIRCEMEIQTENFVLHSDVQSAENERQSPEGAGDDDQSNADANPDSEADLDTANGEHAAIFSVTKSPERVFKVVFVGDSGVGKSSIIHRFCQNSFKSTFSATIGIDFQIKAMNLEDQVIALQIWDTAGQERFRSITKQYFRKADGVIIVYDVTNTQSYLHLREWMESIDDGAEEGVVKMVIGNKIDLVGVGENHSVVDAKHGSQLADEYAALFYEVSAKSGSTVNEAFIALASVLKEKEDKDLRNAIQISANIEKKKGCCNK